MPTKSRPARRRYQPSPAQQQAAAERRAELSALSSQLRAAMKSGLMPYAELASINECLELVYRSRTGQKDFASFVGWKERGFAIEAGARGFAIWGRPLGSPTHSTPPAAAEAPAAGLASVGLTADGPTTEEAATFYPIAYLFHAGQVRDAAGERPASYLPRDDSLALVPGGTVAA